MINSPLIGTYGLPKTDVGDKLKSAGCNALWFHGFNEVGFEGCLRHGLEPCVEFKTFRGNFDSHPELIPIGVDGKPIRYGDLVQGVCLSREEFIDEREEALRSGVKSFAPAGIWFDYLTGAGWFETPEPDLQESCFCDDCIADFCRTRGIDADTPTEILRGHQDEWTAHKCDRVAGFGRRFTAIVKQALPDCIIGAYMCPWTPEEFNGGMRKIFAQDYGLFGEFVDVFTPLIYAEKSGRPPSWAADFLVSSKEFVPDGLLVQPILDYLDFPDSLAAMADGKGSCWGFQMFGGAAVAESEGALSRFAELIDRFA